MGEAKDQLEFRIKKYSAKVLAAWTIVGAVVTTLVGIVGSCWSNYLVRTSEVSVQCRGLEEKCSALSAALKEKDERINDQRTSIAELKQTIHAKDALLAAKDTQLLVKESDLNFFKVKYFEKEGRMITREDSEIAKQIGGTIKERVGIDDKMTSREKIEKSWKTPLLIGMRPGVFLPAPEDILHPYFDMVGEYAVGNYTNAVRLAGRVFKQIKVHIDATNAQVVDIDVRFGLVASEVCRILAESEFAKGRYKPAAALMQKAAGIVGNKPPARLLALESAIFYRAGFSYGYLTKHMADAIERAKDDAYTKEIHRALAQLGYLQRYYPNKSFTDIGDEIDWSHSGVAKSDLQPIEKRNGEIWSRRWVGFGKYEEYNLSQEFREALKKVGGRKREVRQKGE